MKTTIETPQAPAALGPYSQAIITNGMLYASGQIAIDPETNTVVSGGIEAQTKRVLANIEAVLTAANLTPANVVKTTVFLKNMGDFATVNELYGQFFVKPFPARSCVAVAQLPKDVLIEIEIIAAL